MSKCKLTILCLGVVAVGVWVALKQSRTDRHPEDTGARFIQRSAVREVTSQPANASTTASRGMTTVEFQRLCAVNCLYFMNRLHGIHSTYEDVKAALQPGKTGVSMAHLAEVAKAFGYSVTPIQLSRTEMFDVADAMIVLAFPDGGSQTIGHFGVVVPVQSQNGYWLFEPPRKSMWVSRDQMKEEDHQRVPVLRLKLPKN